MVATKAASLADDLVQRFEERIETGEMPPGSRFPTEKAMTEDFGVSRTVVREAYSRLAARGLLESRRGSGAYVPDGAQYRAFQVTAEEVGEIDDVLKLLEMRMGFEAEMADLAARRRTEKDLVELHRTLDAMTRSSTSAMRTRSTAIMRRSSSRSRRAIPPRRGARRGAISKNRSCAIAP